MKRNDENLRDVFDRLMPPAAPGALEDAAARVLPRLREGRHHEAIKERPAVSRLRYGPRFTVAAAVLIATVGIGLYGIFPFQPFKRESPPPAVLPTQIAAITQGKDTGAPQLQLPRLKFAAASLRPAPTGIGPLGEDVITANPTNVKCLGVDGQLWAPSDALDSTPPRRGRCTGQVVYLHSLVLTAYASSPLVRLVGSPLGPRFVQIEAVADDPERVTKGELKLMLQTLLEDRSKVRVHTETRELDGYVLTIAESGIKFKETSSGERGSVSGVPRLNGNYTMGRVERFLSFMLGLGPIADKTGLTGTYNIKFDLEELTPPGEGNGVRGAGGGANREARQFTTPVPKALEEQLGLHLERAKVPVEFVVIDHLELPTEN